MSVIVFKDGTKMEATILFSAISVLIVKAGSLFYILNKDHLDDKKTGGERVRCESCSE